MKKRAVIAVVVVVIVAAAFMGYKQPEQSVKVQAVAEAGAASKADEEKALAEAFALHPELKCLLCEDAGTESAE